MYPTATTITMAIIATAAYTYSRGMAAASSGANGLAVSPKTTVCRSALVAVPPNGPAGRIWLAGRSP